MSTALPVARVAQLDRVQGAERWLVQSLWSEQAVGFIAGSPKSCKSWLGLELAVAVASHTPCLGRFEVQQPGPALVYLAEDSLPQLRRRVEGICQHRHLDIDALPLHVVTADSLRLDSGADVERLEATLQQLKPRLLVLDPLVRLHRIDENSSAEVSALLGLLRQMQRAHQLAIVVVHHMSKRRHAQLGQALRGSTDLHAWSDSAAYLVRQRDKLMLSLEHRSAPALEPFELRLIGEHDSGVAHLEVVEAASGDSPDGPPQTPLSERVRDLLAHQEAPMSRTDIRKALKVNNQRLGEALIALQQAGHIRRQPKGFCLVGAATQGSQLSLV